MRHPHRWEELLPEEFDAEFRRAPIAYVPGGVMEEHGLHNPLGVDAFIGYEICRRAVEISGGILFPLVPFGPAGIPGYSRQELRSGTKRLCPPSVWTSRECCRQLYLELLESIADMGFKVGLACHGHWPGDLLLQEIEREHQSRIGGMKFWGGGDGRLIGDILTAEFEKDPWMSGHGTMWETSMVMAIQPEWVDLTRAQRILESPLDSQLKDNPHGKNMLRRLADSNPAFGERLHTIAAHRLAKLATDLLNQ